MLQGIYVMRGKVPKRAEWDIDCFWNSRSRRKSERVRKLDSLQEEVRCEGHEPARKGREATGHEQEAERNEEQPGPLLHRRKEPAKPREQKQETVHGQGGYEKRDC